jgi:hypothetical protein
MDVGEWLIGLGQYEATFRTHDIDVLPDVTEADWNGKYAFIHEVKNGGYKDDVESKWPEIQDAIIDAMMRLEKALRPFLQAIH